MTKFAIRMLGEPVEFDFEVATGAAIEIGDIVGWIEGFKAVTDLYCPMAGQFVGFNAALGEEIGLVHSDPYDRGWLYRMEGTPGKDCVDAAGYAAMLDGTIDKMMGSSI
jgi:glycine cleavage system H protein